MISPPLTTTRAQFWEGEVYESVMYSSGETATGLPISAYRRLPRDDSCHHGVQSIVLHSASFISARVQRYRCDKAFLASVTPGDMAELHVWTHRNSLLVTFPVACTRSSHVQHELSYNRLSPSVSLNGERGCLGSRKKHRAAIKNKSEKLQVLFAPSIKLAAVSLKERNSRRCEWFRHAPAFINSVVWVFVRCF